MSDALSVGNSSRQAPTLKIQKRLFATSGNHCGFPGCTAELAQGETIVGEICHIKGASLQGPRYDDSQSPDERNGYDNLLLLCANHHKVVDDDPETYTVERLLRMKRDHESGQVTIPPVKVEEVLRPGGPTFINHFHGPVNTVVQGHGTVGSSVQSLGPVQDLPMFQITVDETGGYLKTKSSLYSINRTFCIKVENTHSSRTIHGCKIHLRAIEPRTNYEGPWVIDEGFSLAAGDHKFIPLVAYGEARDPKTFNCADGFVELIPDKEFQPTLDKAGIHRLSIRATGIDASPCDFTCRIWVDDEGRLRAEAVNQDKPR